MKTSIKRILLVAVVAIIVTVMTVTLVACGDSNVLRVATNAEFAPFEYMEGQEFKGIDMDLIRAVGEKLEMEVQIKNYDFDGAIAAAASGTADVVIAGLTVTEDRKESLDFTQVYFDAAQVIIVKEDSTLFDGVTSVEDAIAKMNGAKAAVAQGQTGHYFIAGGENNPFGFEGVAGCTADIQTNVNLCLERVRSGNANFMLADDTVAKNLVKNNSGFKIITVDGAQLELTTESYAIGVKKGNKALIDKLNKAINELDEAGTITEIKAKYLG